MTVALKRFVKGFPTTETQEHRQEQDLRHTRRAPDDELKHSKVIKRPFGVRIRSPSREAQVKSARRRFDWGERYASQPHVAVRGSSMVIEVESSLDAAMELDRLTALLRISCSTCSSCGSPLSTYSSATSSMVGQGFGSQDQVVTPATSAPTSPQDICIELFEDPRIKMPISSLSLVPSPRLLSPPPLHAKSSATGLTQWWLQPTSASDVSLRRLSTWTPSPFPPPSSPVPPLPTVATAY